MLRVFEELAIPIDVVTGTSIGGIIGALIAAGYTAAEIEDGFRRARLHRILELDPRRWGILGTGKLYSMLMEMLGERHIEELPIPFATIAVDLVSGREILMTSGRVVDAALATSAVPGIFPPVQIADYLLADGGIFNNVPVDAALRLGAGRTIAVDLIGVHHEFTIPDEPPSLSLRRFLPLTQLEFAERAIELMVRRITAERLQAVPPDLLLAPDVSAISMFEVTRIDDGLTSGEAVARAYADELIALREWRMA
ncbi:MAG: patatin [Herpetosiphonaceae bacterium]|nr:MAG: patatin [Herpetosiphonaceae bacterium]